MKQRKLLVSLLCVWALSLAHCGSDGGLNAKMDMSLLPQNPIVIDADLTLYAGTDDERVIKGPWFLLNLEFVNNATVEKLYVVTVELKISGPGGTKTTIVDPTITCTDDNLSRPYITILDAGETFFRLSDPCDLTTDVGTGAREGWYVDALPKQSGVFTYSVIGTAKGWIADANDTPIERLVKTGVLITQ